MAGVATDFINTFGSTASAGLGTANGNGDPVEVRGYDGAQMIRVTNTGTGTCTFAVQGSFDSTAGATPAGATWHTVGFYRVDGQTTLTRAVSAAIGATGGGSDIQVLQVLDLYRYLRGVISSTVGTISVDARLMLVAQ